MLSDLSQAISQLPLALRGYVEQSWQEFIEAGQATEALNAKQVLSSLPGVWACSDYVSRCCVRYPGLLVELQGDLCRCYQPGDFRQALTARLMQTENEAQLSTVLRQFRRREMVRIMWRDLAAWAPLEETMADLSMLADVCLDLALDKLYRWQCAELEIGRAHV